ncbi:MAG: DEAD/DEAH box helicase [Planctomycetota bacterium]|nr:DEAD/DEAH box helicase [Planctomycetota bacterium]
MSNFDILHPALQHHIVNSLGWRELRPFQEAVIPSILEGQHHIILAPTAGGKTEAAFFPVLSRMLTEGWPALSLLYICPIKALLNNLDIRLQRYCSLVGRRSALWHGDVKTTDRKHILQEPPDCLLTTPESLEVMLVSPNVDSRRLFANLQAVIVDEIHAFAGDDRGWHLLSVLKRVQRLAGRELQRIGLSATVGNPEDLGQWLAGSCQRPRCIFLPLEAPSGQQAEVKLDFVGSLRNAAVVISRLHRGEKRLVFIDSRARAEELGAELRQLNVTNFVTHSSLSQEQRHQAEEAFSSRSDCVIVATSVLELGIDVGDLDRVIQIDSPPTVSSLLQRMGRTGRRSGTQRNCLFLATRDETLIQAAGLIDLWVAGYVEPVVPPPEPYHILAQQLMAIALQEGGVGRTDWLRWIAGVPAFASMSAEHVEQIVSWMLEHEILWDEAGILWLGREGESTYGHRNFLELFSVFTSPPLFSVLHGRQELGYVDELTFLQKQDGPKVLLLGGRAWQVNYVDWQRRMAYVEATEAPGRSRWKGAGRGLSYRVCQAIKQVLAGSGSRDCWSQRTQARMEEIRAEFSWLDAGNTVVLARTHGEIQWWTFGGAGANASLSQALSEIIGSRVSSDSLALSFGTLVTMDAVESALQQLRQRDPGQMRPRVEDEAVDGLKFSESLPRELAVNMLQNRLADVDALHRVLSQSQRFVSCGTSTNTATLQSGEDLAGFPKRSPDSTRR